MATGPDHAGALWIPTDHCWPGQNTPRYFIVHGTGSSLNETPQNVAAYFQTNNPPTSTHYVVGRDGTVVQCVAEADAAWGNGAIQPGADPWWTPNPNCYTISAEHVNDSANGTPLTPEQQAASFALIKDVCQRHGIPMRPADATGGITGHYSIDPVNRAHCPGNYPWDALWAYLGTSTKEPNMSVSPVWNATTGTLAYPAHDGIPALTLDHGQAAYAHDHRAGCYPLEASFYDGAGDSIVLWDDGVQTRAVKTNDWQIVTEDAGPELARAIIEAQQAAAAEAAAEAAAAHASALQGQLDTATKTIATLQQQMTTADATLNAHLTQLDQELAEAAAARDAALADNASLRHQLSEVRVAPLAPRPQPVSPVAPTIVPAAVAAQVSGSVKLSLFKRSRLNLPCTPGERVLLRVLEQSAFSGIIGIFMTVPQYLALGRVDWRVVGLTLTGSLLLTILNGLSKYVKAHGDGPVAQLIDAAMGVLKEHVPAAQIEPDAPLAA